MMHTGSIQGPIRLHNVTENDLIQAIVNDRDNTKLRLEYADSLESAGDTRRAEYIRVACNQSTTNTDSERRDLQAREHELLDLYHDEWSRDFLSFATKTKYSQGFLEELSVDAELFSRHVGRGVFRNIPLRSLTISCAHPVDDKRDFGRRAFLSLLLMDRPHSLEALDLANCRIGDDGLSMLLASPIVSGLRELCLEMNSLGVKSCVKLAQCEYLQSIRKLNLGSNKIDDSCISTIELSSALSNMEELIVWNNDISDEGAIAIARSVNLQKLSILDFGSNSIGPIGAEAILASQTLPNLSVLDLSGNDISHEGVRHILECPCHVKLSRIVLNELDLTLNSMNSIDSSRLFDSSPLLNSGAEIRFIEFGTKRHISVSSKGVNVT